MSTHLDDSVLAAYGLATPEVQARLLEQREQREHQQERAHEQRIAEIRRTLEILHPGPKPFFEIRALDLPGRFKHSAAGYFTDYDLAAEAALTLDGRKPLGVYVGLNEPNPALFARSPNKITDKLEHTTADTEIVRRQWLFIDCDPMRPAGVSANDAEQQAARELSHEVEEFLAGHGWPLPIIASSGNGFHLLYSIDLPNDDESRDLVKAVLTALSSAMGERFADPELPRASVDQKTYNAARICRLYGTTARKGHAVEDRPHRRSELFNPPEPIELVPRACLQAMAALATKDPPRTNTTPQRNPSATATFARLDIPRWLSDRGVAFTIKEGRDRVLYLLDECPFDANHGGHGEVSIGQFASGKPTAECKHNSCSGRGWKEFAHAIGFPDDEHFDPPLRRGSRAERSRSQTPKPAATAGSEEQAGDAPAGKIVELIPSSEFATANYRQRFLVDRVLVADQPAIVGGRSKTLKTSIAVDLALSLGTGTRFLDRFDTHRSTVAILSGESGQFTIQETAKRIAVARGIDLSTASVFWGFDLPQLARPEDLGGLAEAILANKIDVAIIDPAYLCLMAGDAQGRQASNVFDMGPLLLGLTDVGQQTGSTIILCHHCRKNSTTEQHAPPELDDLSMAGFTEWARQWMLLGRRGSRRQASGTVRGFRPAGLGGAAAGLHHGMRRGAG